MADNKKPKPPKVNPGPLPKSSGSGAKMFQPQTRKIDPRSRPLPRAAAAAPVRSFQGPPAPARSSGPDGRGYTYGGPPNIRPPQVYQAEALINQEYGPEDQGYDFLAELAALGLLPGGGPGGGGSRGGGGGPSNPDPMGWNAIAREQARKQAYAGMGGALDQQEKAQLDAIAAREGRIKQSGVDARKRLDDSIAGLNAMATQTGQQVGQAYGQAGANIDQLLGQYAGQQQALGQGAARTLGAFGVGGEELGVLGPSIQQTMGAYRGGLSALGGISQADIAQRPLAYQALSADRLAGLSASEQRALAEAEDERARIQADIARQKAELAYRQLPELFGIQDAEIARKERFA